MLDCDASFVSVPEFASIRRSLPASLMGATALRDGPHETVAKSGTAPVQKAERQTGETFTAAMQPAFFDHLPASDLPPIPVPPLVDLRAEAARHFTPPAAPQETEAAGLADPDLHAPDSAVGADQRPVTPRRPLRFTSARGADEATPVSLPSFDLFEGVFEDNSLEGPDVDPRLQRSRARARAHLAAMEATLTPVERNLWQDDVFEADTPAEPVQTRPIVEDLAEAPVENVVARAEGRAIPRRPVRHLSPSDAIRTPRPAPQIHDPLRDRLRDLRDILYTPTPEEAEAAAVAAAKPARQPVQAMVIAAVLGLVLPLVALVLSLFQSARQTLRTRLAALPKGLPNALTTALPSRGFAPRLSTAAVAALAALAIPIGLMGSGGLTPFL